MDMAINCYQLINYFVFQENYGVDSMHVKNYTSE